MMTYIRVSIPHHSRTNCSSFVWSVIVFYGHTELRKVGQNRKTRK